MNDHIEILLRIGFAIFSGIVIGLERKQKGKPVGIITNTLVCVGAAILSIFQQITSEGLQIHGFSVSPQNFDPSGGRIIAQIVSGIGFLGAGTIIRDGSSHVSGITTAAMLWIMGCLGIVIGYGFWFLSLAALASIAFIIFVLKELDSRFIEHRQSVMIIITLDASVDVQTLFEEYGLSVQSYNILKIQKNDNGLVRTIKFKAYIPSYLNTDLMIQEISSVKGVSYCTFKKS